MPIAAIGDMIADPRAAVPASAEEVGGPGQRQRHVLRPRGLIAPLDERIGDPDRVAGWKPRDLQLAWLPMLEGIGNVNYLQDPVFRSGLSKSPDEDLGSAIGHYLAVYVNPSLGWDDLARLREWTSLPVVVKGILHPDDASEAARRGIDGIVVSNHGGRQVDGAIASLDALPAIADAVGGDVAILLDSGVRSGADVFKALALGADAVLVGRPYLWGLALGGEEGVATVLRMLLAELDLTMALSGETRVGELSADVLTVPG